MSSVEITPSNRTCPPAIVVIGEAPTLAPYLATVAGGCSIAYAASPSTEIISIALHQRRLPVIVGQNVELDTQSLVLLRKLQQAGGILFPIDSSVASALGAPAARLLPWHDLAWFVMDTHARYPLTADARVEFAERTLERVDSLNRSWLASALMNCPSTIPLAAKALNLSSSGLNRRLQRLGYTWHQLCEDLVVEVSKSCASRAIKAGPVASELHASPSELSRRLRRLGCSWRRLRTGVCQHDDANCKEV